MTVVKEPITFEWDKGNELKNWLKHGVTRQEAEEVFEVKKRLLFLILSIHRMKTGMW